MRIVTALFGGSGDVLHERNFQLLMIASLPSVLGTTLISPILDALTGPFDVSLAEIGLMVTVFSAPAIVLIPLIGVVTDRIGRKVVLVVSLLLFGAAGTSIVFTTDFRVVLGLRLLQGIGAAGLGPVIVTCIGDLYTGPEEATGQGFRLGIGGLTNMVFPIVAGTIVVIGWRHPFLLYAVSFPAAYLVYRWFDEPTAVANGGDPQVEDGPTGDRVDYVTSLVRLTCQPHVLSVLVARASPRIVFVGFLTYNSAIVVQLLDGTPGQAGLLVAIFSGIYAVSGTQSGRITALFSRRGYPLIGAHLAMGGGMLLIAFAPTLIVAGLGVVVVGAGFGFSIALYRSLLTSFASEAHRGGLVSIGESGVRIAGTLTPVVMGVTIGLVEPVVGLQRALQWTVAGAGVSAAGIGLCCTLVLLFGVPGRSSSWSA